MHRITLIILGLACAVLTAAGMMWYNNLDNPAVIAARRQLYDKDSRVRQIAIWDLAFVLHDKESIPEIRKRLYDEDVNVRQVAIDCLSGFMGLNDKESIPTIRKFLNDENKQIRYSSICFLAFLKDKESISQIKMLLNDEEGNIREIAERALKQLGVPEAEIQKAKEDEASKVDISKASELIIAHIFKQTPAMNHPSVHFQFIELPVDDLFQKMGWQIFKNISTVWTGYTYIISKNKVFDFLDSFGSSGLDSACVSDIDRDGQYELIFTHSGGSGIHCSTVGLCYKKGDSIEKSGSNLTYLNGPWDLFVWKENDQKIVVEIGKKLWKFGKWEKVAELGTVKIENKNGVLNYTVEENKDLPDEFKQYIDRPQQPAKKK